MFRNIKQINKKKIKIHNQEEQMLYYLKQKKCICILISLSFLIKGWSKEISNSNKRNCKRRQKRKLKNNGEISLIN